MGTNPKVQNAAATREARQSATSVLEGNENEEYIR